MQTPHKMAPTHLASLIPQDLLHAAPFLLHFIALGIRTPYRSWRPVLTASPSSPAKPSSQPSRRGDHCLFAGCVVLHVLYSIGFFFVLSIASTGSGILSWQDRLSSASLNPQQPIRGSVTGKQALDFWFLRGEDKKSTGKLLKLSEDIWCLKQSSLYL